MLGHPHPCHRCGRQELDRRALVHLNGSPVRHDRTVLQFLSIIVSAAHVEVSWLLTFERGIEGMLRSFLFGGLRLGDACWSWSEWITASFLVLLPDSVDLVEESRDRNCSL